MAKSVQVEVGDQVYSGKSTEAFGGVRAVHEHDLIVDIEGKGDVKIPAAAVEAVHDHKVIITASALPPQIGEAIAHAHEQETQ